MVTALDIAQICHEANRAFQIASGDPVVSPHWADASPDQRDSSLRGVVLSISGQTPEELHQSWCDFKVANGWVFGPVKDEQNKTHPCLVPYDQLPESDKVKDHLFSAIVNTLKE